MRSELDPRTIVELAAEDEALYRAAQGWSREALVAAVVSAIVVARLIDRQINDLRRQLEALGVEPCA